MNVTDLIRGVTTSKQSSGIYCDAFGAATWQGCKLKVHRVVSAGGSLGLQRLQNSCCSGHFLSCVTVITQGYTYPIFISTQADFKIRVSKNISKLSHVLWNLWKFIQSLELEDVIKVSDWLKHHFQIVQELSFIGLYQTAASVVSSLQLKAVVMVS